MKSLYDGKAERLCKTETACELPRKFGIRDDTHASVKSVVIMTADGDDAEVLKRSYDVAAA